MRYSITLNKWIWGQENSKMIIKCPICEHDGFKQVKDIYYEIAIGNRKGINEYELYRKSELVCELCNYVLLFNQTPHRE